MTIQTNNVEFRVTQTQKLIAAKALETILQEPVSPEDPRVENTARTLVVIQTGGMGAYYREGLQWSHASRARMEPEQVAQEVIDLEGKVATFQDRIDRSQGDAARRIRGNRVRRIRDEIRFLEESGLGNSGRAQQLIHQLAVLRLARLNRQLQQAA